MENESNQPSKSSMQNTAQNLYFFTFFLKRPNDETTSPHWVEPIKPGGGIGHSTRLFVLSDHLWEVVNFYMNGFKCPSVELFVQTLINIRGTSRPLKLRPRQLLTYCPLSFLQKPIKISEN